MNIVVFSRLPIHEQSEIVRSTYDVHHVENVLSAMQFLLGTFKLHQHCGEDYPEEYRELFEQITEDDIISALDLFSARYNELIEAGPN